jgi:hypothetical protein
VAPSTSKLGKDNTTHISAKVTTIPLFSWKRLSILLLSISILSFSQDHPQKKLLATVVPLLGERVVQGYCQETGYGKKDV